MTREERIKAGWVECWGLRDANDKKWLRGSGFVLVNRPRTNLGFEKALEMARTYDPVEYKVSPCRFWRRRKPKALAVGDTVLIRGTVTCANWGGRVWIAVKEETYAFAANVVEPASK